MRFGKSKIHRWGVFAMEPIRKDDMLLEYRGEVIGNAVAEKREKVSSTMTRRTEQEEEDGRQAREAVLKAGADGGVST